ncbi:hypothetical protein D9M73_256720 [compost metagenome]
MAMSNCCVVISSRTACEFLVMIFSCNPGRSWLNRAISRGRRLIEMLAYAATARWPRLPVRISWAIRLVFSTASSARAASM